MLLLSSVVFSRIFLCEHVNLAKEALMVYGAETWVPIVGMIAVLIWGLRLLSRVLFENRQSSDNTSLIASALTEKSAENEPTSFSRVAGSIGAVSLAAFMAGLGLWVFFAISDEDATMIDRLSKLSTYFLGGAALFAPYAFNQLSKVFKTG